MTIRLLVFLALALGSLAGSSLGFFSALVIGPSSWSPYLWALSSAVLVSGVTIGWFFSLFITRPLVIVTRLAREVAAGDTSGEVPVSLAGRPDESGELARAFRDMTNCLRAKEAAVTSLAAGNLCPAFAPASHRDILGQELLSLANTLVSTVEAITQASTEVFQSSSRLDSSSKIVSQGAREQAANLLEISENLGSLRDGAIKSIETAEKVNSMATRSWEQVLSADRQMEGLVQAMKDLNGGAQTIRAASKSIDDIAFQTTILALNARIEAARAGKYGRGFSEVAADIRKLADRSSRSVVETSTSVETILRLLDKNTRMVEETSIHLAELRRTADSMSALAREAAEAGRVQGRQLVDVAGRVDGIDKVTVTNLSVAAANTEEVVKLNTQARVLQGRLERFRLPPGL